MADAAGSQEDLSDVWLARTYGSLIHVRDLAKVLGFSSAASLREAHSAGRLQIPLFKMTGRRGWFAYAGDVGAFLRSRVAYSHAKEEASQ